MKISPQILWGRNSPGFPTSGQSLLTSGCVLSVAGGLDQVRLEGDPRHSHSPGGAQQSTLRHSQRSQHVEATRQQCAEERLWNLYVPDQHRPHALTGNNQSVLALLIL